MKSFSSKVVTLVQRKKLHYWVSALSALPVVMLMIPYSASAAESAQAQNECLLEAMETAPPNTTVEQLRQGCEQLSTEGISPSSGLSVLDQTIRAERQSLQRSYTLTPHQPNFILPYTYMDDPNQLEGTIDLGDDEFDDVEAEFQVSVKFPLKQGLFDDDTDLLVAYTGHSWWQVYNDASAPFRETNYQPEIFLRHYGGPEILGAQVKLWDLGFVHESNGRSDFNDLEISRSWNRIYGAVGFEVGDVTLALRAWYRIPEDDDDDNNPGIYKYRGYGQVKAIWAPNKNTFTAMYRPGTKEDAVELTWSYPFGDHLRFYAKYFNGYGESLIDYDYKIERIGIGFTINDLIAN